MELYNRAAAQKPRDGNIQGQVSAARIRYAAKICSEAAARYKAGPRTLRLLTECIAQVQKAAALSQQYSESRRLLSQWSSERADILRKLGELLNQRDAMVARGSWDSALSATRDALVLDPDDPKYDRAIDEILDAACNTLLRQSNELFSRRDYQAALAAATKAIEYRDRPEGRAILRKVEDAVEAGKMLEEAQPMVGQQRWSDAESLLAKVTVLDPENIEARTQLALCRYEIGLSYESAGRLAAAIQNLSSAKALGNDKAEAGLDRCRAIFYDVCAKQIQQFEQNALYGNMYIWLRVLEALKLERLGDRQVSVVQQQVKDLIMAKATPRIAVLDFRKRTYKSCPVDMEQLIPDLIVQSALDGGWSSRVRLSGADRGHVMDRLRESGLEIGRTVDESKLKDVSAALGSTVIVYGETGDYDYKHEKQVNRKSKEYISGHHTEPNPDYQKYLKRMQEYEQCEEQTKNATGFAALRLCIPPMYEPDPTREVEERSTCRYTEENHTVKASLSVEYLVFDSISQHIVYKDQIMTSAESSDKLVQGGEAAGVADDPLDLPAESEVARNAARNSTSSFLRHLASAVDAVAESHFKRGQDREKTGDMVGAMEDYVAASILHPQQAILRQREESLVANTMSVISPEYIVPLAPVAGAGSSPAATVTGQKHAVLVGVDTYQSPKIPKLAYAQNDALLMFQTLTSGACGFRQENVQLLLGPNATLRNIRSSIGTVLSRKAAAPDTVLVFFAGHGAPETDMSGDSPDGYTKYLLPWDADPDDLFSTALPFEEIARFFGRINAANIVFLTDACYSGESGGRTFASASTRGIRIAGDYLEKVTTGSGHLIITASDANELSLEVTELRQGLFTYYLADGLRGGAETDGDGSITVDELYRYVSAQVSRRAREMGGKQNPVMKGVVRGQVVLSKLGR